jgi:hypothetical protein
LENFSQKKKEILVKFTLAKKILFHIFPHFFGKKNHNICDEKTETAHVSCYAIFFAVFGMIC